MSGPSDHGAAALDLLARKADAARSDPERTEAALAEALRLAPEDLDVRLGAYRFYFYNHRYEQALVHCEALIGHAARRLNVAIDWRDVGPGDAAFTEVAFAPGLYLQALLAWGYCHLRLGRHAPAREALSHSARLDPTDRFGAAVILGYLNDREMGGEV
ncbi:hypothetical protein [Tropicimonas isoalkanivorans]|uniref:Tetratricopeptide repeat-containing protein n=1 Tax=Tropicimonas isoalkanivorans TaxID=441112 RepID=A0A1I1H5F9_9RHOB|nr:hypothetical protein [Tropicimonas isoalkanivorans]SFC19419.1 hypothetical protein SAMN04488094_10338 [Tropicimonas isoalkanivorans]